MSLDDPEFTSPQPQYGHAHPGHKRGRGGAGVLSNDGWSWDRDEEMGEQKKVSYLTTNPVYLNYHLTLDEIHLDASSKMWCWEAGALSLPWAHHLCLSVLRLIRFIYVDQNIIPSCHSLWLCLLCCLAYFTLSCDEPNPIQYVHYFQVTPKMFADMVTQSKKLDSKFQREISRNFM